MKASHTRFLTAVVAAVLAVMMSGCSQPKSISIQPNIIRIKPWIVLGPTGSEMIGDDSNRGCRLAQAEIDIFRAQLIRHRRQFSANLTIEWFVTNQQTVNDPTIPPFPFQPRWTDVNQFHQAIVSTNWLPGYINIYFTGNVEDQGLLEGETCDPSCNSDRPFILINDGGLGSSFGHMTLSVHDALEHEFAHYLLRRNLPQFRPPYLPGEHLPAGSQHVLSLDQIPPVILPTSEMAEITTRVVNGTWNQP